MRAIPLAWSDLSPTLTASCAKSFERITDCAGGGVIQYGEDLFKSAKTRGDLLLLVAEQAVESWVEKVGVLWSRQVRNSVKENLQSPSGDLRRAAPNSHDPEEVFPQPSPRGFFDSEDGSQGFGFWFGCRGLKSCANLVSEFVEVFVTE